MSNQIAVFFKNAAGYGWTEKYIYRGPNDVVSQQNAMNDFVYRRCLLAAADNKIERIRFNQNIKRFPSIYDYEGVPYAVGQVAGKVNSVDDAVIMRLVSTSIGYNRVFLRGLPDAMVDGEQFKPTDQWLTDFSNFVAGLRTANWGVKSGLGDPGVAHPAVSAVQAFPKGYRLKTLLEAGLVAGNQIRVTGSSIIGYNGVKNVVMRLPDAVDGEQYLIGGAQPPANSPDADHIMWTLLSPVVGPVDGVNLEQFTLRKAGRPFGLRRGRARTQLSLRP